MHLIVVHLDVISDLQSLRWQNLYKYNNMTKEVLAKKKNCRRAKTPNEEVQTLTVTRYVFLVSFMIIIYISTIG